MCVLQRIKPISLDLPQQLHHVDCITQWLGQRYVICLRHGQSDLRLNLVAPDDGVACIQYCVTGPRLGGAWFIARDREIPVTTKIGIEINFKSLVPFGIKRDYLSLDGLQLLHKVYYWVSKEWSWILIEDGTLMRCVGNIQSGNLLQEVELYCDWSVVEALVKRWSGSVTSNNIGGQVWRLPWRSVLLDMGFADDTIKDLCMH